MSKEAALRAMREARYAERTAKAGTPARRVQPPERSAASQAVTSAKEPGPATDELCGHRSMNGRTCTREAGHAAKSHRYG